MIDTFIASASYHMCGKLSLTDGSPESEISLLSTITLTVNVYFGIDDRLNSPDQAEYLTTRKRGPPRISKVNVNISGFGRIKNAG